MAHLPLVIVLALGAAAMGGPEALGLLFQVAVWIPTAHIIIGVFVICASTSFVLGTMVLARYIRVADENDTAPLQPATARFATATQAVALAVVTFIFACLLAIPSAPAGRSFPAWQRGKIR